MNTKKPWLSKTLWINLLAILAALVPAVRQWIQENPVTAAEALAAVNLLLRFATKDKVALSDDTPPAPTSWLPLLVIAPMLFLTVGCGSWKPGVPVTVGLSYDGIQAAYSSKGGVWVSADVARLLAKQNKRAVDGSSGK